MEHIHVIWGAIVAAVIGLVAIVATAITSVGYIRREAAKTAETVAEHVQDVLRAELASHYAEINEWRRQMEEWRRSFHDSIRRIRDDIMGLNTRAAVFEASIRRVENELEAAHRERVMRHQREFPGNEKD